jgi:hypothetical protein
MSRIEMTANVAAIITCLIALGALVDRKLESRSQGQSRQQTEAALVGRTVAVERSAWISAERTVVIATKASCPFCMASMPLYRRLSDLRQTVPGLGLVIVSPDTVSDTTALLEANGILPTSVYQVQLATLGIRSTPTVMVVNRSGTVESALIGKLDPKREEKFLNGFLR